MAPSGFIGAPVGCFVILIALVPGVLMLWWGFRPIRRGSTPHCARCDYNLTGLTSERCPECGQTLTPESIVLGETRRRPVVRALGIIWLLAFAALVIFPVSRAVQWYRLKPATWVFNDFQSSNALMASKAWRELQRRTRVGSLSAGVQSKLIELCLKEQANTGPNGPHTYDMVEYLGDRLLAGQLSETQKETCFEQAVQFTLNVRPKVLRGDNVVYDAKVRYRVPCGHLEVKVGGGDVWVDGQLADRPFGIRRSGCGIGAGGSSGGSIGCDQPGKHTLKIAVVFRIIQDEAEQLYESRKVLEGTFEVFAEEPPDYFKLIEDPAIESDLRASIEPIDFSYQADRRNPLAGKISVKAPPSNIAFDVIARIEGQEYRLSRIFKKEGESTNWSTEGETPCPQTGKCDIILRSNPDILRNTIDLYTAWKGELVYKDVPVDLIQPKQPE